MNNNNHVQKIASFRLESFKDYLAQVKDSVIKEGNYRISNSIFISRVEADSLYYTGINWQAEYRILFSDLENIILSGNYKKDQIRMMHLPAIGKLHAIYYSYIVYDFMNYSEIARAFSRPVRRFAA